MKYTGLSGTAPEGFRACGCDACAAKDDSASSSGTPADPREQDAPIAVGGSASGTISEPEEVDSFTFEVVAGETYTVSLRGSGADPLGDTYLWVYDQLDLVVDEDDDGGIGTGSLITFTAATSGTYEAQAGGYPGDGTTGGYTIDVFQHGADSVADDLTTTDTLPIGETLLGALETDGDADIYSVTLEEGGLYVFQVAGGADYQSNAPAVPPGELDTIITIYDADGKVVATGDDISYPDDPSSGASFVAAEGGQYFVEVSAYDGQTGGYALEVEEQSLAGSPLDSIDWGTKVGTNEITVYFASEGESYDGVTSLGWTAYEKGRVMAALGEYARVANLTFSIVEDAASATFKLLTDASVDYLGYFNPPGTENEGVGVFSTISRGWDRTGLTDGLEKGGFGFITLVHEIGHALGLAHPHDDGGSSTTLPGVISPFGSYGAFDLNQGVYTTMTYNDGWATNPDGDPPGDEFGWQSGPMALDIALIQQKYGSAAHNSGNTVYTLRGINAPGTHWSSIWDTDGNDVMIHNGTAAAVIDLRAATLQMSRTGGGLLSRVDGIFGGFTIANGVVIENATGGSGSDRLVGNTGANRLNGRGGADVMLGAAGNDTYFVENAGDRVVESSPSGGIDIVRSSVNFALGANVEKLVLLGTATNGTGNALANSIFGNAADNRLDGGGGADAMSGGGGNDVYHADNVRDRTVEGAAGGVDAVVAEVGFRLGAFVERLVLLEGASFGIGNNLANRIVGNDGSNSLNGGTGADRLFGGDGNDRFLFRTDPASGADLILDFAPADDSIVLDRTIFAGIAATGTLAASAFRLGTAAQDADDRILYDKGSGRIFYDADGAGGAAAVLFARVDADTDLTRLDFLAVA